MVYPRPLVVEAIAYPTVNLPSEGGAPAVLVRPDSAAVKAEFARILTPNPDAQPNRALVLAEPASAATPLGSPETLAKLLAGLQLRPAEPSGETPPKAIRDAVDAKARQLRQIHELDRHNQKLLLESPYVRQAFMGKLDTSSLEKYEKSVEEYRSIFRHEVVGAFDQPLLATSEIHS